MPTSRQHHHRKPSPYRCFSGTCDFSINARGRLWSPQPRNKPRLKTGAL